jgi:hypothetical protein
LEIELMGQTPCLFFKHMHLHAVHRIMDETGRLCNTYGRDQKCVQNVDRII